MYFCSLWDLDLLIIISFLPFFASFWSCSFYAVLLSLRLVLWLVMCWRPSITVMVIISHSLTEWLLKRKWRCGISKWLDKMRYRLPLSLSIYLYLPLFHWSCSCLSFV
jgi:hypothetical protein